MAIRGVIFRLYINNKHDQLSIPVVGRWQLQSADSGTLVVSTNPGPKLVSETLPCRATTWNSLPVKQQTSSLSSPTFAKKLRKSFTRLLALPKTLV